MAVRMRRVGEIEDKAGAESRAEDGVVRMFGLVLTERIRKALLQFLLFGRRAPTGEGRHLVSLSRWRGPGRDHGLAPGRNGRGLGVVTVDRRLFPDPDQFAELGGDRSPGRRE